MPLPRFENLDSAMRDRILAAAQAEFARDGYEGASLARVAAEAGISKGTLYYYFADRDDLYATIVLRLVRAVGDANLLGGFAPKRAEDFWPALDTLFRAGFELARQHPDAMRALRSFQVSLRSNPRAAFEPVVALMSAHMRLLVETGRRLGCVRSDVSVELLVALLQSADEVLDGALFAAGLDHADAATIEQQALLALDTFRRLLEPAQPSAARREAKRPVQTRSPRKPQKKRGVS